MVIEHRNIIVIVLGLTIENFPFKLNLELTSLLWEW